MIWGVAGLRPNFFSRGLIFWAELAQESWRDLAAVGGLRAQVRIHYTAEQSARWFDRDKRADQCC